MIEKCVFGHHREDKFIPYLCKIRNGLERIDQEQLVSLSHSKNHGYFDLAKKLPNLKVN